MRVAHGDGQPVSERLELSGRLAFEQGVLGVGRRRHRSVLSVLWVVSADAAVALVGCMARS